MRHDLLSDVFSVITNAENVGKGACTVPASSLIKNVLEVMKKSGYIGEYELVKDGRGDRFVVRLVGRINRAQVIKPRFAVKYEEFDKFEERFLLSDSFGVLIISTPKGVMTQKDAREKKVGGKLLGFVY